MGEPKATKEPLAIMGSTTAEHLMADSLYTTEFPGSRNHQVSLVRTRGGSSRLQGRTLRLCCPANFTIHSR